VEEAAPGHPGRVFINFDGWLTNRWMRTGTTIRGRMQARKRANGKELAAGKLAIHGFPWEEAKMLIYFAGPLFNEAEQAFNLNLTETLEEAGFTVFLPQRDGIESKKLPYSEMAADELRQSIFTIDRDKVLEADIFLFVLDGRVPDDGACVELGIAYGQKYLLKQEKYIIGLHTDMRGAFAFLDTKLNPIILGAFDELVEDVHSLMIALETYQQSSSAASGSLSVNAETG